MPGSKVPSLLYSAFLTCAHSTYTGPRTKDTIRSIPSSNISEDGLDEEEDDGDAVV